MINNKNLKQDGGEKSTNYQGQNLNIYSGLNYLDVKQIALDIFKTNFTVLRKEASKIAEKRAEEITEKIITKIINKNPEVFDEFNNPAMQDALFLTQKEFAKSGDKEIGDLLVDIIVDRVCAPKRNMLQIILDDSLQIAPKLILDQLDTLTLNFLLNKAKMSIYTFDEFLEFIKKYLIPFTGNIITNDEHYKYLEHQRCGHIRNKTYGKLEENFRETYSGVFSNGFSMVEFEMEFKETSYQLLLKPLLIKSFRGNGYEFNVQDEDEIKKIIENADLTDINLNKITNFFNRYIMNEYKIKTLINDSEPQAKKLFEIWDSSLFNSFELSHVGIAIAHANFRRKTGETLDLSIWIK